MISTSWLTVAITIERFIAIRFALKAHLICTVRRAKIIIAAIFTVPFLSFLIFILVVKLDLDVAKTLFVNDLFYRITPVITVAVASFIPEVFLCIFNASLVYFLVQQHKSMYHIKESGRQDLLRLTIVVITMVSVFMICHSVGVYLAISIAVHSVNILETPAIGRLNVIYDFLLYVNSSVNFILYTAISKRFRDSFNKLCC